MTGTPEINTRKDNYLVESVRSAYDLSSCGMGIQLRSVADYTSGKALKEWEQSSISNAGSNYLVSPYIMSWMNPDKDPSMNAVFGPKFMSPRSPEHRVLIKQTYREYDELGWSVFRAILADGQRVEATTQPHEPLSGPDIAAYLTHAIERNVVVGNPDDITHVQPATNALYLHMEMIKAGLTIPAIGMRYTDLIFSGEYSGRLRQAAIHKLGTMLAITDQLMYESYALGSLVPATYKPEGFDKGWQELFDKPVPTIGELFAEAFSVFQSAADPGDAAVKHLFVLERLPHLIK